MKRIIITERQYKRLVNLPLNEQNVGGGEIKFSEGYSENDIKGNRVWKFLNVLREKLWEKYNKNLFIIEVGDTLDFNLRYDYLIVDLDLDKYTKKENRYIKKLTKEETGSPGSIFYNIKYGYIYFPLTDSEFENDQTGDNEVTDGSEESKYSIDFGDLEQGDIDLEDEPYEVIDVSEDTSFVLPIPNDNIKVVGRNEFLKSPANEKVDVEYVFDFFKGKGLKDYQSCGILGNIFHESRFNTGIIGDSRESMGIVQWHKSRLKQLSQYSKIKDKPITDKDLQLGFLWNELNGTYSYVLKELTDSTTIKEASFAWACKFEVCSGCCVKDSDSNKERLEESESYLEEYSVPDDVPDIPFRNKTEGNAFRKWVNDNHKEYADKIDLDPTGHWKEGQKHFKGYMLKAWNKYGKEYVDGDYYEELEEISSNDGGCELSKCQFRVKGGGCKPFDDLTPDSENRKGGGLNFDEIPDGKNNFRSAAPSAEQMLYILQNNPDIKKIISFDDGRDDEEMTNVEEKKFIECYNDKYGTTIKWVRVDAEKGLKSGKGYVGTLNEVLPSLDDGNNLIHCTHGADRTGYVVAKHLKDVKGWSNEKLWDYTVEYNSWEGKSGYICEGTNVKYLNYLEGFYPLSEWCKKDKNKDCPSCKK